MNKISELSEDNPFAFKTYVYGLKDQERARVLNNAVKAGDIDFVRRLLDLNVKSNDSLFLACQKKNFKIAQLLFDKHGYKKGILYSLAKKNNYVAMKYLLDQGVDMEFCQKPHFSPLHVTAYSKGKDSAKIARLLIKRGANINLFKSGVTPLHACILEENILVLDLLLKNKARTDLAPKFESRVKMVKEKYKKSTEVQRVFAKYETAYTAKDWTKKSKMKEFINVCSLG
ncbi:MAG: hypothetical protein K940chlam3_00508 [Chlamydiae bacterium]|nr:hypothetical protein [Chlamydiota bacterium]